MVTDQARYEDGPAGTPTGSRRPDQEAPAASERLPGLLALQRSAGNAAVAQLLRSAALRTRSPAVQRCSCASCACGQEHQDGADEAAGPTALEPSVQRATPGDFQIRGKFADAASVPNTVFFDFEQRTPDGDEQAKIALLVHPTTPPSSGVDPVTQPVTLRGSASEEGPGGVNTAIVTDRIASVSSLLANAGHSATRTPEALPAAGAGSIDYRRVRSVEIRNTGATSATPDCSAGPAPNDCGPSPNAFATALARAHTLLATAQGKLAAPDPATNDLLTKLFGSTAIAPTVSGNLGKIDGQLTNMVPFGAAGHRCVNLCDSLCGGGATAYNTGDGPGALMTLCPIFMADPDLDARAAVLIHEGSHGTSGLQTGDQSYEWQRLITQLPPALALSNADSYSAFVQLVNKPGSITLGPDVPDTHSGGMSPDEQKAVDRAVAWVQQWVMGTESEISSLYGVVNESRPTGVWSNDYYKDTMAFVAPSFGLTPPPVVGKKADQVALAGINDRFQQLLFGVSQTLDLRKASTPGTTWDAGPGTGVDFGTGFFATGVSPRDQAILLLDALVRAAPTISAGRAAAYLDTIHHVEVHLSLGSP